jgi:hypothetical protein
MTFWTPVAIDRGIGHAAILDIFLKKFGEV